MIGCVLIDQLQPPSNMNWSSLVAHFTEPHKVGSITILLCYPDLHLTPRIRCRYKVGWAIWSWIRASRDSKILLALTEAMFWILCLAFGGLLRLGQSTVFHFEGDHVRDYVRDSQNPGLTGRDNDSASGTDSLIESLVSNMTVEDLGALDSSTTGLSSC